MKNCPLCNIVMLRVKYEGLPAFKCDRCKGYLLEAPRLKGIERNVQTPEEKLIEEAREEYHEDSRKRIECPKCKGYMKKTRTPPPAEILIDTCERCRLVWLDGGELAILQLQYEMSRKGEEEEELRKRVTEMRGRRRKDFEENLEKLREGSGDFVELFGDALIEGTVFRRWSRFENLFE
jgi:Zn-finger nucleic acid-binding protein